MNDLKCRLLIRLNAIKTNLSIVLAMVRDVEAIIEGTERYGIVEAEGEDER